MYDLSHEKYMVDTLRPVVRKLGRKQRKYKPEQGESVPLGLWIGPQSWQGSDVAPRGGIE